MANGILDPQSSPRHPLPVAEHHHRFSHHRVRLSDYDVILRQPCAQVQRFLRDQQGSWEAPGGVVVIHVTNRYLDIAAVVAALAADWAVLAARREDLADLEPFNNAGVTSRKAPVWTDDYSDLFEILR
jgi:hypothetical protein